MAKSKSKTTSKKVAPAKKPAGKSTTASKAKPAAKSAAKTPVKAASKPVAKKAVKAAPKSAPKSFGKPVARATLTKAAPAKATLTKATPAKAAPTKAAPKMAPVAAGPKAGIKPVSTSGKSAPVTPKPTPTIIKPTIKMPVKMPMKAMNVSSRDDDEDSDDAATAKRAGTSSDLFSEEELMVFRNMLNDEKRKIAVKSAIASGNIALEKDEMYDEVDLASATVEQNLTLRLLDRDRKLMGEIDHAIAKIDTGDYGFCEGTGEVIPKRRLELRPWCRHSVKYKEQLERMKKSGRGVADEDDAF